MPSAIRVAFVAYQGVSLLDLSGPLEALRVASTHPNHLGAALVVHVLGPFGPRRPRHDRGRRARS